MKAYEKFLLLSFKRLFGIQSEVTPEMANVVPVVQINDDLFQSEKIRVIKDETATTAGTVNIYTTPIDRRFYLTDTLLSLHKTSIEAGSNFIIQGTVNGGLVYLNYIKGNTTLADERNSNMSYRYPILLDPGTAISLTTEGSGDCTAIIFGFEEKNRI